MHIPRFPQSTTGIRSRSANWHMSFLNCVFVQLKHYVAHVDPRWATKRMKQK